MDSVSEWVGSSIPDEGTEDHDRWTSMLEAVDDIKTLDDVIEYLELNQADVDDFFVTGQFDLIAAGMEPTDVPAEVASSSGLKIASQQWSGGSWVDVYEYKGYFFVINEVEKTVFNTEEKALESAGIGNSTNDDISSIYLIDRAK